MQGFFYYPIILCSLMSITFSCGNANEGNDLYAIFEKWKEKTVKSDVDSFRSVELDDSGRSFLIVSPIIDSIYNHVSDNDQISSHLDSLYGPNPIAWKINLGVAFHRYLNGHLHSDSMTYAITRRILMYRDSIQNIENNRLNKLIVEENYSRINPGDTMLLVLPVDSSDGEKSTFYYSGYPYSSNYITAHDSLAMEVILVSKQFASKWDGSIDSANLTMTVRILSLDHNDVMIAPGKKYMVGDQFELLLEFYGRAIIVHKRIQG